MSRNIAETIMGAAVLAIAGYFFFTAYAASGMKSGGDFYVVTASFSDVTGISNGSDVRIGGIKIGTVSDLSLNQERYTATLSMNIRDNVKLPGDSDAAIIGESLLGGKFVAITPGGSDEMLEDGGEIEFTQSSVSLEQLLGKFVFSGGGVESDNGQESNGDTASDDDFELSLP